MKYLISIIIPVFNVEAYIKECFESIRRIRSNDIEIICIDDGSTDNSGMICDEYSKKDKRFKIVHKTNGGVSSARNIGIEIAKGKYIAWVDPDDYVGNDWYQSVKDVLNNNVDFIFFDYYELKNKKIKAISYEKKSKMIDKEIFLKETCLEQKIQNQLWRNIYKKELMIGIKLPLGINLMEDYAVLYKIILNAKNIYYLSKNIYFYRLRDNSLVSKVDINTVYKCYLISKERYDFIKKNGINITKLTYLLKLIRICVLYHKVDKENEKKVYREIYTKAKKMIRDNIVYILKEKDISIKIKFKFLLCYFNFEGIAGYIYNKKLNKIYNTLINK